MIRQGHLKLIAYAPLMPGSTAWPPQLFDLHADPWEKHNIAPKLVSKNLRSRRFECPLPMLQQQSSAEEVSVGCPKAHGAARPRA